MLGANTHGRNGNISVGELIATYRRRRLEARTGTPWSQEQLALASGTNQAHISRIESNRKHPQYTTLVHICDALSLPAIHRSYLLALAGYPTAPALPAENEVTQALEKLAPLVKTCAYPAVLIDRGERVWYINELAARLWGACLGSNEQPACLASVRGKQTLQFLFDPHFLPIWKLYFRDIARVMDRQVSLFWRAYHIQPHEPHMNRILECMKRNTEFLGRWQDLEDGAVKSLFVEFDSRPVVHPEFGSLHFSVWRTTCASDERFLIAHFTPSDDATRHTVHRLIN